jgi:hypothetical protein
MSRPVTTYNDRRHQEDRKRARALWLALFDARTSRSSCAVVMPLHELAQVGLLVARANLVSARTWRKRQPAARV